MRLDGVLFLDGLPVMYLKEYARPFTTRERLLQQRLFWNQGVANVLVLADPTSVYIYSGMVEPVEDENEQSAMENALTDKLSQAEYVSQIQSLYHGLATGHFYEVRQGYFDPNRSVDARLLDNLRSVRDGLTRGEERLNPQKAHALIGRTLFLCYLLDREIFSIDGMEEGRNTGAARFTALLSQQSENRRIDFLYDIFSVLKEQFNGNMFDQDLDAEKDLINSSHLKKLLLFLGGHDVKSGQLSFWPYDFKMIPVETISAVYQDFLAAEDPEKQRQRGAFYTPRFLAEMVVDMVVGHNPDALEGSFLDPACGSGIFLVILFNRMANRWLLKNSRSHYSTKVLAFQEILSKQIQGVDLEETACRIACFSLYLAYLDFFDPPDIREYIERSGRPLPKLLDYGDAPDRPAADIGVIYKTDFLDEAALAGRTFDFVIGNPPWEGRGKKQLAQNFVKKVPGVLRKGGTGCLLLPSKVLQNQTDAFQSDWLSNVTLEEVLQLADYRFLLFQNALCPAFIARFVNTPPQVHRHMVNFNAPKFNRDGLRQGIIKINPSSRTWIPLVDILSAARSNTAPVVWKRRLWGTPRDQKLLNLLQSMPLLNEHVDILSELRKSKQPRSKRWVAGQGLKPWAVSKEKSDRQPKALVWRVDTPFIEAKSWNSSMFVFINETTSLEKHLIKNKCRTDILYSQPPTALFLQPLVLISQGYTKIAFCNFNVLFQHTLQSIAGPEDDADLLKFLAVYLRSKLSRYFLFHTSANWGSERDKVHLFELLRVPFPVPGSDFISPEADLIVKQVAEKIDKLQSDLNSRFLELKRQSDQDKFFDQADKQALLAWHREKKALADGLQGELEPLIYQYFGLTDQEVALVEDTNDVFIPSATPSTWHSAKSFTLDPVGKSKPKPYAEKGLGAYANTLTATLNAWAETEGASHRVCAEGVTDADTGLAMVTIRLSQKEAPFKLRLLSENLFKAINAYNESITTKHGAMEYERDIIFFQGEMIHIIRPNILLNWTRTAALNDAARIYGEIVMAKRES